MQQSADESVSALRTFLQEDIESLQGIVRSYVLRAGLAHGEALQSMTLEILHEAAIEALAHAEIYHTVRQPRAWFLGITANIIKRRRALLMKQSQRELSIGGMFLATESGSESEFFDQLSHVTQPGPEQEVELRAQVADLLSLASPEDRRVLRLAFLQDLDTYNLALALNVPHGTARVRLHRALSRLRTAWGAQNQQESERGHHE